MPLNSDSLYDRHITIFSPEGRLYQVEYAIKAVELCGLTAIALKGPTAACVAVQKKVPLQHAQQDQYLIPSSIKNLFYVTPKIGAGLIGFQGDCRSILHRARNMASDIEFKLGHEASAQAVAQRIADFNQVYSQHAYMRLHACSGVLLGIDEDLQIPEIYKFDPAGWFAGYKACAIGRKEQDASNALEKVLKTKALASETEVVEETLLCLQSVLNVDLKSSEVEVGVVTVQKPEFRLLPEEQIENHLNSIAERD